VPVRVPVPVPGPVRVPVRELELGRARGLAQGPVTGDYLEAIAATRATVSSNVADEFLQDIEPIARV
jgi:hypothetical protein